jgi:PAS domain S-box-containing protein
MHSHADDAELERLRQRLAEAEDSLRAIRTGEIDAIVVQRDIGPVVYTLKNADTPYRVLVEQMREGALTVSAEGVILYANAAFANMVGLPAERLRGMVLMELVDEPRDQRTAHLLTAHGGRDVRLRTKLGEPHDAYISSAPMTLEDKEVHCVIVIDLTRQELRRRHEAIVNSSADAIYSLSLDGTIATWNQAAERLYGYTSQEVIGRKVDILFPPQEPGSDPPSARLLAAKRPQHYETVRITKSGKRIEVAISVAPFSDGDTLEGFSVIARDIGERNRTQEHIKFLLRESSHRAKNLLSVIQAIASQTARSAETVDEYQHRFSQRLRSLALSHDLLIDENWKRVRLSDLVRLQLSPFVEPGFRLQLEGPDAYLTSAAAEHMGLALHELATNAMKYGALSTLAGHITISWAIVNNGVDHGLQLTWRERNGPHVTPRRYAGFGSIVTEKIIAQALDAKVTADFAPGGLCWSIEIPPRYLSDPS